ncbi:hypothetical protein Q2406_00790 (plasmid) [Klebsiella pneumoniae]|nr:hypothetical protein [Klebsiella pneumoniae]
MTELALQTDKGIAAGQQPLVENLRRQSIHPARHDTVRARERQRGHHPCQPAYFYLAGVDRFFVIALTPSARPGRTTQAQGRQQIDVAGMAAPEVAPFKPNSRHMLEHIERLKACEPLDLPAGIERQVHQNRLLKIAREGGQMTPAELAKFEMQRRYATLVSRWPLKAWPPSPDEIIDLHDRIIGKLFNAAKNKHQQRFQTLRREAINDKVRMYGTGIGQAGLEAKQSGGDPFAAIQAVMPWDTFAASVTEAQKLA